MLKSSLRVKFFERITGILTPFGHSIVTWGSIKAKTKNDKFWTMEIPSIETGVLKKVKYWLFSINTLPNRYSLRRMTFWENNCKLIISEEYCDFHIVKLVYELFQMSEDNLFVENSFCEKIK